MTAVPGSTDTEPEYRFTEDDFVEAAALSRPTAEEK